MFTSRLFVAVGLLVALAWILTATLQPLQKKEESIDSVVVATVDGHSITLHEVEQSAALSLFPIEQQRSQLLHQALQRIIEDRLLNAEAARKGITVSELLKEATGSDDITRLANLPTTLRPLRPDVNHNTDTRTTLEDVHAQARIRQALLVSLRRKYSIHVTLPSPEPPVLAVSADDDPSWGPLDAPVTIVEFSDFQCPYCKKSVEVLQELRRTYEGKIRLAYRDYPSPNHPYAGSAAEAAQCANDQGKFWDYHDRLFEKQTPEHGWDFTQLAKEIGLDQNRFTVCLNTGRYRKEVAKDLEDALKLGVTSTPTFFINGRPLIGARPASDFIALIDRALAETSTAITTMRQ